MGEILLDLIKLGLQWHTGEGMHGIEHGDPFSSLFAEGWVYPAESLGHMVACLDKSVPPTQTGRDLVSQFLVTVTKHTRKGSKRATTSFGSRFQRVPHGHLVLW